LDWQTGNLFYTSNYVDKAGNYVGEVGVISRRNNKNYRKAIFSGKKNNIVKPREIVVDSAKGTIVWTDWDRKSPRIMQANMDGSNQIVIMKDMQVLPNGLAIDHERSGDICFLGASSKLCKKKSSCPELNFTQISCIPSGVSHPSAAQRVTLVYQNASGQPYALAAYNNQYFWTDWQEPKLYSIHRDTKEIKTYAAPIMNNSRMYGLAIMPKKCTKSSNACAKERGYGGCSFICLPGASGGRKCLCPDSLPRCFPSADPNVSRRRWYF